MLQTNVAVTVFPVWRFCKKVLHVAGPCRIWHEIPLHGLNTCVMERGTNLASWALLLQNDLATTYCICASIHFSLHTLQHVCYMRTHKVVCPLFKARPATCNLACADLKRDLNTAIERFSIACRETETKLISLANHKERWRWTNQNSKLARSAGKCVGTRHNWLRF